jgi:hypothetical protein
MAIAHARSNGNMVIPLHVQPVLTEHVNQLREAYHTACHRAKRGDETVVNVRGGIFSVRL